MNKKLLLFSPNTRTVCTGSILVILEVLMEVLDSSGDGEDYRRRYCKRDMSYIIQRGVILLQWQCFPVLRRTGRKYGGSCSRICEEFTTRYFL